MIIVYDKPGTLDRYTVAVEEKDGTHFFGMSENPQGFNQYVGGPGDSVKKGRHLGEKVAFSDVPKAVLKAIIERQG